MDGLPGNSIPLRETSVQGQKPYEMERQANREIERQKKGTMFTGDTERGEERIVRQQLPLRETRVQGQKTER